MDVYCQKCGEPWDSYGLHIDVVDCKECDGSGKVELREARIAENNDDGYTSLAVIGYDESSGITYEECDCQNEDTWEACSTCAPYHADSVCSPGELPRPYVIVEEPALLPSPYKPDGGMYSQEELHADFARYRAYKESKYARVAPCACDEGFIKRHTHGEEYPCNHGSYDSLPTCDSCMEEIEAHSYFDVNGVITDGGYRCMSCAREEGMVEEEEDCRECNGKGKVEKGRDAMEPDEIRMFRAGKGCPACDFGVGRSCESCHGSGRIPKEPWFPTLYGHGDGCEVKDSRPPNKPCSGYVKYAMATDEKRISTWDSREYRVFRHRCARHALQLETIACADCHGTGREPLKDTPTTEAAKLIASMCEHVDDMAAMSEDLIGTGFADSLLGDDEA